MDIKSKMTSIQPKVTSNDTEISQQVSKQPKLLSDEEIATARGSQDMFQVVDSEASQEFELKQGDEVNNRFKKLFTWFSSRKDD